MDDMPTDTLRSDGDVEPEGRDDSENDAPQGMERRLVLRLLTHWRDLAGEREYPSFSGLDPTAIPEI